MTGEVTLTGMVLFSAPVNEYDKRVVLLTKERGKITAFAKGAKRPKSPFMAATQQFVFGQFTLYEGKSAYNMVSVKVENYFEDLLKDIDCIYYGSYFLEFAEYFSMENMEAGEYLLLLYQSLRALLHPALDNRLVRRIFEWKMLVLHGEYPEVFSCMKCGGTEELNGFSLVSNGTLCKKCQAMDKIDLQTSTVYALQYVVSSDIGKLFNFQVSEEVLKELEMVMNRLMSVMVDKQFKSLEIYEI